LTLSGATAAQDWAGWPRTSGEQNAQCVAGRKWTGFESNEGVILIAATTALMCLIPLCFVQDVLNRRWFVPRPDIKGREEILRVHTRKVPLAEDVDLSVIARGTPGFSGPTWANLVKRSRAFGPAPEPQTGFLMIDFEMSKDKVLMGSNASR